MTPDEHVSVTAILKAVKGIHGDVAADVWPHGARLVCNSCGRVQDITTEQCGYYLGHGWPVHCGKTMELVTLKGEG